MPKATPFLACTATVTRNMREQIVSILELKNYAFVQASPDRPNIYYEVRRCKDIADDFDELVASLRRESVHAPRVIVYCRSLDMCAHLYLHFLFELGKNSYFPPGAEELCSNRLFAMYHSCTPQHNKEVVLESLVRTDGVVRIVFATIALGMGIDLRDVNTIIHYGAPRSLEDYFQESGRGGRSGDPAKSVIYWKPKDCPSRKKIESIHDQETAAVRRYVENISECRRYQLLTYFDPGFSRVDSVSMACCDVCSSH